MSREGLKLFSSDVQELAETALRQQDRVARHAKGEDDDTFFASRMDAVSAGFGRVSRMDRKDKKSLRTALESLRDSCHEAANAISDTEAPILPKTDYDTEHAGGYGWNR